MGKKKTEKIERKSVVNLDAMVRQNKNKGERL